MGEVDGAPPGSLRSLVHRHSPFFRPSTCTRYAAHKSCDESVDVAAGSRRGGTENDVRCDRGVPLKVVQEVLGHSTVAVTADVYGHVTLAATRDATSESMSYWGAS